MNSKRKHRAATHPDAGILANLPMFCDFNCPHAAFGSRDVAGDCRREQAVYCTFLKRYNNKNNKCLVAKDSLVPGKER